ncbi:hypothetical protein MIND_00069600 [Mycena indigotica]|uniref:Uncharacterized protein n=1 Tax=Mycena indigotica TaxID=2126181 RepID=A0A8H6WHX6_9AGAR|nr:uncharacterized protein MIND_00069600 [Mycena indigotica]KAF7315543.1 hypothetical protein MIND_00069600 [Mycena indigotica]
MSVALPVYGLSPAPSYASLPRSGHSTVEFTPRAGRPDAATGTLTKKWRELTVIFKNQNEDEDDPISVPSYGRNATVCGEIGIENPENVITVTMKLEGNVHLSSTDTGSFTQRVVDERRTLFDAEKSSGRPCPSVLGFAVPLPMTYKEQGRVYRTPPSYETICLGSPLIVVKCTYRFSIKVTRVATWRLSLRKSSTNTFTTPIIFRPRTRPARPLITEPSFMSSLKVAPAEWHQTLITIPTRPRETIEPVKPITCHFVIPSVQTFCLAESIPFHIQLCGSPTSLGLFYGSITPESLQVGKKPRKRFYSAVVRVFLARQIYLDAVNGRQSWRTITIGEANVRAVVPSFLEAQCDSDPSEISLNWDGEVQCKKDITCASFNCAHLVVKDFIIVALTPANVRASPLLPIQHAHSIRLVTDGWTDNEAHPEDR